MKEMNFCFKKTAFSGHSRKSTSIHQVPFLPLHTPTDGHYTFSDMQICKGIQRHWRFWRLHTRSPVLWRNNL